MGREGGGKGAETVGVRAQFNKGIPSSFPCRGRDGGSESFRATVYTFLYQKTAGRTTTMSVHWGHSAQRNPYPSILMGLLIPTTSPTTPHSHFILPPILPLFSSLELSYEFSDNQRTKPISRSHLGHNSNTTVVRLWKCRRSQPPAKSAGRGGLFPTALS